MFYRVVTFRFFLLHIMIVMFMFGIPSNAWSSTQVARFTIGQNHYYVNGQAILMDVVPYIKNDRTFLPVRYVALACGVQDGHIIYNADEKSIVLLKYDTVIRIAIGSYVLNINADRHIMDVAPEIVDDRTFLPLRYIAEALGANVSWEPNTRSITLTVNTTTLSTQT